MLGERGDHAVARLARLRQRQSVVGSHGRSILRRRRSITVTLGDCTVTLCDSGCLVDARSHAKFGDEAETIDPLMTAGG
jgi:hypothetical protein